MSNFDRIQRNKKLAVVLWLHILCLTALYFKSKIRKRRTRPKFRKRLTHGEGNSIRTDRLRFNDAVTFFETYRMTRTVFEKLLILIGPVIQKQITTMRAPIPTANRLLVTLRHLATGDDQSKIATSYGLGKSTVNGIITNTCKALWNVLMPVHMSVPTETKWKEMATDFWNRWDFPNCIGAIGGMHVRLRSTCTSKIQSHEYDDSFIMLVLADARYKITVLEVGETTYDSDHEIFVQSSLGVALESGMLDLPQPAPVSGALSPNATCVLQNRPPLPYVIAGDEGFPLLENLMCPFPQKNLDANERIFNRRLSRARIVVENVFGILSARWCFYLKIMSVKPETWQLLVKASCVLHNYLCDQEASQPSTNCMYCPQSFTDHVVNGRLQKGEWRNRVASTGRMNPFHCSDLEAFETQTNARNYSDVRTSFSQFFSAEDGKVPWQFDEN